MELSREEEKRAAKKHVAARDMESEVKNQAQRRIQRRAFIDGLHSQRVDRQK